MENRDAGFEKREEAREKYKPRKIEWLLIAEAPPEDLDRYFYFETTSSHDDLFRETIHAMYRKEFPEISTRVKPENGAEYSMPNTLELRKRKSEFLLLFKNDRFYLIDALENPIPQSITNSRSAEMVMDGLQDLVLRMKELASRDTNVILIKSSVCAIQRQLLDSGFKVINDGVVPFPSSGQQKTFRDEMAELMKPYFREKKKSLARC